MSERWKRRGEVEQSEGGEQKVIDTRPSDAVALALRAGCPLRVAESVLAEARDDGSKDDLGHDAPPKDGGDKGEDAAE